MELILNDRTYVLKNVNSERRFWVLKNILSLLEGKVEGNIEFRLSLKKKVQEGIWLFLKPEDKKELGTVKDLKVKESTCLIFIQHVSEKIKQYCEYVKKESFGKRSNCQNEDLESIYAFLAKQNSWTKEYIREMDELDLLKSIKEAIKLKKRNVREKINHESLVAAFASGSKQAKRSIDKMNLDAQREEFYKKISNTKMKSSLVFSEQELNSGEKNG